MAKNKKKEEKKVEKKEKALTPLEDIFADPRVKGKLTREVGKALKVGYVKALLETKHDISEIMAITGWSESSCRSLIKLADAIKPISPNL